MNAQDVIRCLNNRFSAPEWVFLDELSLVPGFIRNRRADAVALNCWASGKWGLSFIGFEIKVSRSDFLHELKHPAKRKETYLDVDGIFFATPKGLVAKAEVPADCGLIECWTTESKQGGKTYSTRIQKYPEAFKTAMDHMEHNASANLHLVPAISRAVAVAVIRAFDPDRINQDAVRDAHNLKYEIKALKTDLRYKEMRVKELEGVVRSLTVKEPV
jgi:hypothetical protein